MKKRTAFGTLVGLLATLFLLKAAAKIQHDLRRYDHLRSLSDEGPVMEETPDMLLQVATQERHFVKNWISFFRSVPTDIARYTKIESM